MLEIRVLGGLEVELDGRPVQLPADARARELLGWLVVAQGPHARSTLAGRLRPEVGEESARKTLRDAVYELRRALGPEGRDAIVATRDQVGLEPARVRADLWEFRRHAAAGELAAATEGRMGELLAGMDADWVLRARDEHAAELGHALASLAEQAEAAGELDGAVRWTRRRLEIEPLAEEAHRDLIRRLARAGDRPAALTAATALAERLRRELGVPPAPETRALVEEVRRGRGDAAPPQPAKQPSLPPALMRTAAPEGRRPTLDRLERAWNEASRRRHAGRAARRRARHRQDDGGRRADAAGPRRRRRRPLRPLRRAGADPLPALGGGARGAARRPAARRGRALADRPRRRPGQAAAGPRRRGRARARRPARYLAFESVRGLLEHTAAARPVLLVLDDLHWIDADSAALLRHITGSLVRAGCWCSCWPESTS